jgi:fucose permease
VLGSKRYAATRINLAQSGNGIGWVLGPIIGGWAFYSTDALGRSTGSETLYIPYVAAGLIVLVLSVIFYFSYMPDIKTEDEYHLDDATPSASHSIWTHPHFVIAVAAQFLYVAAQAGIFSFFINYMTEEVPSLPASWHGEKTKNWIAIKTKLTKEDIKDLPSFAGKLKHKPDAVSAFLSSQLSSETRSALADYKDAASDPSLLRSGLIQDLNKIIQQDTNKVEKGQILYQAQRFNGVVLGEETRQLLSQEPEGEDLARLNRLLLRDAYPGVLAFQDGIIGISDQVAANLLSIGYFCFFIGRLTGAGLLKKFSAHKILGLYCIINVAICLLIFFKLSWLSVACVFLSFFFMSIMFPTIFALGIFGLGARAKKASAFIVMAIMGGALLPKLMGHVADVYDMSRGFIVPMFCFLFIAFYGFCWPRFSKAESLHRVAGSGGH